MFEQFHKIAYERDGSAPSSPRWMRRSTSRCRRSLNAQSGLTLIAAVVISAEVATPGLAGKSGSLTGPTAASKSSMTGAPLIRCRVRISALCGRVAAAGTVVTGEAMSVPAVKPDDAPVVRVATIMIKGYAETRCGKRGWAADYPRADRPDRRAPAHRTTSA